jgi:uroporphyrin-III C-methyltransferase / precorrin-2 dehydrogenase / sirohydrochlorin ferrochelatase
MPPEASPFPVFLDLAGALVLVVGGGEVAVAKCRLLGRSRALICAVDPEPCPDLVALAEVGAVQLHRRPFLPGDLDRVRLCYVGLEDEAAAAQVVAAARRRGVLVNAVDRPALCDFSTPAMVERGPLTIAIGTGGAAPALARDLRARIEAAIPPAFGRLVALMGRWRGRVAEALADKERRRAFWDRVIDGPTAEAVLAGDETLAERLMASALAGALVPRRGRASLVGAGPGDPELLTLKALRVLKRADVILYDKLANPAVLELARRDARRIDVGKRCGRHPMSQAAINRLLIEQARAGAYVVRLKGGDPSLFARGGEELESLRAAGIEVEIVPGVSAAFAAAASLAVPLTHRGIARSLHLVTGHGADAEGLPAHDWRALAGAGGTIAVYMGSRTLPELARRLLEAGLPAATPAVAVESASLPAERRVTATLGTIAELVAGAEFEGPTLVLIGEVLALAEDPVLPKTLRHAA